MRDPSRQPPAPSRDPAGGAILVIALFALGVLATSANAQGGLTSNIATVPLTASKSTAISIVVTAGATQSLPNLVDGAVNTFPSPVSITTSWDLHPSVGTLALVAYFTAPGQALVNGTEVIPASWLRGRVATGIPTTFTAFTQNAVNGVGSAGGSLPLFQFSILGNNRTGSRSDALELQLDLSGRPPLTPGTYAGTLNIRAVAQ